MQEKNRLSGVLGVEAFTLIELLVVVLIIGILAAVALPQYQKAVWKSRYATLKSTVNAFAQAEEAYYMANGTYARDADELSLSFPGVISSSLNEYKGMYNFSWGHCNLYHRTEVNSYVECFLNKNGVRILSYARYFQYAPVAPGKQYCGAFNSSSASDVQQRICKSESGLSTPTDGNGITFGGYVW